MPDISMTTAYFVKFQQRVSYYTKLVNNLSVSNEWQTRQYRENKDIIRNQAITAAAERGMKFLFQRRLNFDRKDGRFLRGETSLASVAPRTRAAPTSCAAESGSCSTSADSSSAVIGSR